MDLRVLLAVGVVVAAALAGASGSAVAQSDEELVTLTVEVVVPSSNERVGGVTLVAEWDGGQSTVTTASNGMALIDVPRGANVDITVQSAEYTRNSPYNIRVATEKEHTIEVARKAELDVVVTDAEGPVADASVVLRKDGVAVVNGRTDANGGFQSGTIEQGQYTVSVVKSGYYRTTENFIVAGSPERSVRIERGRVDYDIVVEDPHFDPAQPVSDATVSIEGVGTVSTNEDGAAAPLVPVNSRVRIQVSKDGYETATEVVTVNESTGSVSFSISREPSLSVSTLNERIVVGEVVAVEVTNAYGEPTAGVELLLDGERVAETDGNGEATVRITEPGEHELQARRGGTTSTTVTVRGVGEGGGETDAAAQTTDVPPATETATTMSDESGSGLGGLLGPLLALVVLVALVALVVVYRRRSRNRGDSWTDGTTGTAGGTVDFDARDDSTGPDVSDEPSEPTGSDASDEPSEPTGPDASDEPREQTGSDVSDEPRDSDSADTDQSAGDEVDDDQK